MCENIELNLEDDTVKNLAIIIKSDLSETVDKCSLELYNVDKIDTYEQLVEAVGITIVNSILVKTVEQVIKDHEKEHGPLPQRKV